jgi:hypothetical protein
LKKVSPNIFRYPRRYQYQKSGSDDFPVSLFFTFSIEVGSGPHRDLRGAEGRWQRDADAVMTRKGNFNNKMQASCFIDNEQSPRVERWSNEKLLTGA